MYWRLSASKMREPSAISMNGGVLPTALKARTGEFTPPGMTSWARWKRASECLAMRGAIIDTSRRSPPLPTSSGGCKTARRCVARITARCDIDHRDTKGCAHGHTDTLQPRRLPQLHDLPDAERAALLQHGKRGRRRVERD